MSALILEYALSYAQIAMALALCLACWRMICGPRAQDRVLALDALYVSVMLLFVTTGLRLGSIFLFEAALVIAVTSFVSNVALAKFLMRGEVIE